MSTALDELLWYVSVDGEDNEVLHLLKSGIDPNDPYYQTRYNGETPLHRASWYNHVGMVQHLVQWGARMDATNRFGDTPLHRASVDNNQACVVALLNHHCRTDIKNKQGQTAEDAARHRGHTSLANYIADYKVPPRDPLSSFPSVKQLSTFQVAKWQELGYRLEAELEGPKIDQQPTAAVLLAAKIKNAGIQWKDIVDGLLSIGEYKLAATVCTQQALDGHSPLSVAAYYGWVGLLKFLVDTEGQDPIEPFNKAGDTVLSLACTKGHIGVIEYFLKTKRFDLNGAVNAAGDTLHSLADSHGQSELVKYLDNFNPGSVDRSELHERYVAKLNELIAKRSKTTSLQYLKIYFIGSAGLGKTTTRKRMTGAIVNLSQLTPKQRERCSTYLAECTQVLAVVDESADSTKLVLKASDNLDEEAQLLFNYLYGSKSSEAYINTATTTTANGCVPSTDHDQFHAPQHNSVSPSPQTNMQQIQQEESTEQEKPTTDKGDQVKQKPAATHIKVDVDQVITRLRSIVGSGKYVEELLGKILLNLVDVGGQPGFLEMLPFLSKGPGIFLSFFPLDKDLDELCRVSYERKGEKITPYDATYTNREAISQVLSSISHHVSFDSTTDKELADKLGSLSDVKPVVTLVGTFKDRLEVQVKAELLHENLTTEFPKATKEDMEEAVSRTLDDQVSKQPSDDTASLQSAVEHHLSSEPFKQEVKDRLEQALDEKNEALQSITDNFAELLTSPTDDRCFVPVDNYTGTDSDIDPLRKHLQDVFSSHFEDAKVPIQPSQLLLGIVLRKEYDIVSMEDCIHIGSALNMGEEDVRFAVWFLDFLVGALIYHPEIKDDWFKENIICSPQVVFDSISALIVESLLEIHSPNRSSKRKLADQKEKGQFSINTVKRCHSEESKKKMREGKLIPVDKLILLLEHSNLLSQIEVKEISGGKERVKAMCFIPAILDCATREELTKSPSPDADTPSPVKITFEPQYVPVGVFCAMISRLVSKGKGGILGMKWELADSSVKRNLVTFRVEKHIVTLVAHIKCIEVRIIRQKRLISLHNLSSYVLSAVIYIMKEISSHLCPIIAFDCPCGQHQSDNLCTISPGVNPCFECDSNKDEVSLTPHQQHWFAKEVKLNAKTSMKALPYVEELDPVLSFKWSKHGSEIGRGNELKLEKVTEEDCEGYYTCKILKNGELYFNIFRCLKIPAGEAKVSDNNTLLSEAREALSEVRADWYHLAVELDLDYGTRKEINDHHNAEVCFNVMLKHWVDKPSTRSPPSKGTLVRALTSPALGRQDIVNDKFKGVAQAEWQCSLVKCTRSLSDTLHVDEHLKIVRAATWELRANWKFIADQLDITGGVKEEIEHDHSNQAGRCYTALLEKWLTRTSPAPTWAALIDALCSQQVNRPDIANAIKRDLTKGQ